MTMNLVIAHVEHHEDRLVLRHQSVVAEAPAAAAMGKAWLCLRDGQSLVPLRAVAPFLADLLLEPDAHSDVAVGLAEGGNALAGIVRSLAEHKPSALDDIEKAIRAARLDNAEAYITVERTAPEGLRITSPAPVRHALITFSPDGSRMALKPVPSGGVPAEAGTLEAIGLDVIRPWRGPESLTLSRMRGTGWFEGTFPDTEAGEGNFANAHILQQLLAGLQASRTALSAAPATAPAVREHEGRAGASDTIL